MNEPEIMRCLEDYLRHLDEQGPLDRDEYERLSDPSLSDEQAGELLLRYISSGREGSPLVERGSSKTEDQRSIFTQERMNELLTQIRVHYAKQQMAPSSDERSRRKLRKIRSRAPKFFASRLFAAAGLFLLVLIPILYLDYTHDNLILKTRGVESDSQINMNPEGAIDSLTPVFHWKRSSADIEYRLIILDNDFEEVFLRMVKDDHYEYNSSDPALQPGHTYYWEIQWKEAGKSRSSRAFFRINLQ
jgi:hypothetical protein